MRFHRVRTHREAFFILCRASHDGKRRKRLQVQEASASSQTYSSNHCFYVHQKPSRAIPVNPHTPQPCDFLSHKPARCLGTHHWPRFAEKETKVWEGYVTCFRVTGGSPFDCRPLQTGRHLAGSLENSRIGCQGKLSFTSWRTQKNFRWLEGWATLPATISTLRHSGREACTAVQTLEALLNRYSSHQRLETFQVFFS